ncbi:hypothetical protein LP52_05100 [Streptomonospora alba]|uniref:Uncharacterized protein n=1 Tax=Streptomonospora alba TaxID=183763 RepID=A0A0C2JL49_9ACTN|nr:hypothetical protein LP52_05100 [Streptomonospora alba]
MKSVTVEQHRHTLGAPEAVEVFGTVVLDTATSSTVLKFQMVCGECAENVIAVEDMRDRNEEAPIGIPILHDQVGGLAQVMHVIMQSLAGDINGWLSSTTAGPCLVDAGLARELGG